MNCRLKGCRLLVTKTKQPMEMNQWSEMQMIKHYIVCRMIQMNPHTKRRPTKDGQVHGRHSIKMLKLRPTTARTIFTLLKNRNCMYCDSGIVCKNCWMKNRSFIFHFRTRKLYHQIDQYAKENIESARDESLNTPDVDMPCLVKVTDRFYRGKIVDVFFDVKCDLKVFLVDIGETVQVDSTNVFEIPENLVEMCAYQVPKPNTRSLLFKFWQNI